VRVLAGDIGGTKTLLALYDVAGEATRELAHQRFASAEAPGLAAMVRAFLGDRRVDAAAFALAGPVEDGVARTTNLPWVIEERALAGELGAPVTLLNDFAAVVLGIAQLAPEDLVVLNRGVREPGGVIAVLGAGTGLGQGFGVPGPAGLRAFPSEGGHAHFAPRDDLEQRLLCFLRGRLGGRVSAERVVSGPGLVALYDFVISDGLHPEDAQARARMQREDPAAVIAALGQGHDPACSAALARFLSLYGAEAGDLALTLLPFGGLYVAGGIAAKLVEPLQDGTFLEAFLDKGRMSQVLQRIPVSVVRNPRVGLLGARARACMML
jgi:glucokinase